MAEALLQDGNIKPGVWLPEQVFEPAPYFNELERRGIALQEHDVQPEDHKHHPLNKPISQHGA